MPDPRCVMTTLAQDDLPADTDVLRALVRHNRLEVAGAGVFPCAGVYAVVTHEGTARVGDPVVLQSMRLTPAGGIVDDAHAAHGHRHPPCLVAPGRGPFVGAHDSPATK
jgi:hypothetical protein